MSDGLQCRCSPAACLQRCASLRTNTNETMSSMLWKANANIEPTRLKSRPVAPRTQECLSPAKLHSCQDQGDSTTIDEGHYGTDK